MTTGYTQDHAPLQHPSDSNHHSPSEAIPPRRKRGAPFGNQNAHRPCGKLAESRVKLMELVAYPDTSTELLLQAARAITRMVDVQHKVTFH